MVPYDEHQGCDFKKLLTHAFRFEQLEFEVRTYNDKKREEVLHIITEGMHMNPDPPPPTELYIFLYTHLPVVLLSR